MGAMPLTCQRGSNLDFVIHVDHHFGHRHDMNRDGYIQPRNDACVNNMKGRLASPQGANGHCTAADRSSHQGPVRRCRKNPRALEELVHGARVWVKYQPSLLWLHHGGFDHAKQQGVCAGLGLGRSARSHHYTPHPLAVPESGEAVVNARVLSRPRDNHAERGHTAIQGLARPREDSSAECVGAG